MYNNKTFFSLLILKTTIKTSIENTNFQSEWKVREFGWCRRSLFGSLRSD